MATCKVCAKSGWFLSLSEEGLCRNCKTRIALETSGRVRIINESRKLVDKSTNLGTRISRCDIIIEKTKELLKYEELGIHITNPLPSVYIADYTQKRDEIIVETLQTEFQSAAEKVALPGTLASKVGALQKVLSRAQEYAGKVVDREPLDRMAREVLNLISRARLASYMEDADKAVFKGQRKKALDRYLEALYLLEHELANDAHSQSKRQEIEKRVMPLRKPEQEGGSNA